MILKGFERLSELLAAGGITGELSLLGGTAMVLEFRARQTTKDVDAIFAPVREMRKAAVQVAEELGLPPDWINDAAKGFASARGEFRAGRLPQYRTCACWRQRLSICWR